MLLVPNECPCSTNLADLDAYADAHCNTDCLFGAEAD